jgi:hypothetical protein
LIPNPIRKVLSSIHEHRVLALLMGGQACVFYGAAEFSRDTDFAILASPANLARLQRALDDLEADVIAVPPFAAGHLRRGHAIHFRCRHPEAAGLRIDVMTANLASAHRKAMAERFFCSTPRQDKRLRSTRPWPGRSPASANWTGTTGPRSGRNSRGCAAAAETGPGPHCKKTDIRTCIPRGQAYSLSRSARSA